MSLPWVFARGEAALSRGLLATELSLVTEPRAFACDGSESNNVASLWWRKFALVTGLDIGTFFYKPSLRNFACGGSGSINGASLR